MAAGNSTGVMSRMAGLTSMNVPVARMMTLTSNIVEIGPRFMLETQPARACGTRSSARIHMYIVDIAMIIMIFALVMTAFLKQFNKPLKVSALIAKKPSNKA